MRIEKLAMSDHLAMRSVFHRWFSLLASEWDRLGMGLYHVQDTEERMVLAKRYLDQQSLDAPLNIQQIANKLGWSRVWLHQQVKKQTGKSPSEIREDQQTR